MTGPQDPAATGGDRLRAARADRERVIGALQDAFVHGRLTRDEFGERAGLAMAARTRADLAALTADIPAADIPAADIPAAGIPADPARPPAPARRRPLARAAAGSGGCLAFATAVLWVASHLDNPFGPSPYKSWIPLCLVVAGVAVLMALFIIGYGVGISLEQRRSRSQLPPQPGPGRRALGAGRRDVSQGPVPPGPRADQTRAELRAHQSPRRRHVPSRAGRAPGGARPAPGAV